MVSGLRYRAEYISRGGGRGGRGVGWAGGPSAMLVEPYNTY